MKKAMLAIGIMSLMLVGSNASARKTRQVDPPMTATRGMMGGAGPQSGVPFCARYLMTTHPAVLKSQLNLTDAQIKQIEDVRTTFLTDRVKVRSELQQNQVTMQELFRAKTPEERKILDLQQKNLALRGQIAEKGIKSYFSFLKILNDSQRTELRTQCPRMAASYYRMHRRMMYGRRMSRGAMMGGGWGPSTGNPSMGGSTTGGSR